MKSFQNSETKRPQVCGGLLLEHSLIELRGVLRVIWAFLGGTSQKVDIRANLPFIPFQDFWSRARLARAAAAATLSPTAATAAAAWMPPHNCHLRRNNGTNQDSK